MNFHIKRSLTFKSLSGRPDVKEQFFQFDYPNIIHIGGTGAPQYKAGEARKVAWRYILYTELCGALIEQEHSTPIILEI
jgi:hypothetical protein